MVYHTAVVSVGQWFEKKRAFATGFAFVGSGLGQFVFPSLTQYMIDLYQWRGALYILAGITLHCAVYGMCFVPVERWMAACRPRRPINRKVEINRGDIMTALIESKKRERTISNGSLDNCVITRDNVLIKLDPKLFEGKRNNSIIARFRRQLGFSSQSLASSKNSLQGIPSIVIDAVNKDMNMKAAAAAAAANGGSASLNGSPIYRPSGMTRVQQLSAGNLDKRGSLPMMAQGSNPALLPSTKLGSGGDSTASKELVNGKGSAASSLVRVSKTQSCDVIHTNKLNPDSTNSSADGGGENPTLTRSASDLGQTHSQFLQFGPANMDEHDLRIQSIQLIPNGNTCAHEMAAAKAKGLRLVLCCCCFGFSREGESVVGLELNCKQKRGVGEAILDSDILTHRHHEFQNIFMINIKFWQQAAYFLNLIRSDDNPLLRSFCDLKLRFTPFPIFSYPD